MIALLHRCCPVGRIAPGARATVAVVLALSVGASAETYYVAPPPSGNDIQIGSQGLPWATLQHAVDSVAPGDTILVRAGSYLGAHVTLSGTPTQPIVLKAFPDEEAEIVGDNPTTPDGINLEGASHFVVEGFRVDGRTRAGIRAVLCDGVTIRGNRTDSNGKWGIFTAFCDDLLIELNETSNSVIEHGIYVSNSGDRPVIRNNMIWSNNANGIHMNGDLSAGGDGVISQALVEKNVIFDNGRAGGSGINMDGVQSSVIRNNLLYNNHASGISLYRIDGGQPSIGNQVLNNTVIVASDGRWALNIRNGSTGNVVRNNIFFNYHSFRGSITIDAAALSGFSSDFNVVMERFSTDDGNSVMNLSQWRQSTGQDGSSLVATPQELFVSVAQSDYHLGLGSPAEDQGEALAWVQDDLEGTPRPIGSGHDIGAYEGVELVFADGFEIGSPGRWSATLP